MGSTGTESRNEHDEQGTPNRAALEPAQGKEFYRLFSLLFHRPDREIVRYLRSGFVEDIQFLGVEAVAGFSRFVDAHREKDDEAFYYLLAVEYTRLFVNAVPRVPCPPYESVYREGATMGESTIAVLSRYQEGGLEVQRNFHDLPDHVAVELEFLHYLLTKGDTQAHDRFVREHSSRWVSAFSSAVADNDRIGFYRHAAAILDRMIMELAADLDDREVDLVTA